MLNRAELLTSGASKKGSRTSAKSADALIALDPKRVALENDLFGHVSSNLRCPSLAFAHKSDGNTGNVREG